MRAFATAFVLGALLTLAPMAAAEAQTRPQQQQATPPADSTTLVFEREVFTYPSFARRDPFQALSAMSETGPDFESLSLLGVISSEDPALSVALLGAGAGASSQTFRVRVGETLGNSRVLEIHRMRIVLEVEEFGVRERRSLEVMKPSDVPSEGDTIPDQIPEEDEVAPEQAPIPDEGGSI